MFSRNLKTENLHAQKIETLEPTIVQDLHICPICGTQFRPTTMWVYKRYHNRQELIFCRYNCMRAYDKKKPRRNYNTSGRTMWEQNVKTAHERINTCRRRIREIKAELEYTDLDKVRRARLKNSLCVWKIKLEEAKEAYKIMKGAEEVE